MPSACLRYAIVPGTSKLFVPYTATRATEQKKKVLNLSTRLSQFTLDVYQAILMYPERLHYIYIYIHMYILTCRLLMETRT